MRRLTVKNFSVIKDATLDFRGINVIIGPQASGKSLLCKLASFCLDIASNAIDAISDDVPLKSFKEQAKENFNRWFPVNAWGKEKFEIIFESGPYSVSITRTSYKGSKGDKIRLTVCPPFCGVYEEALREVRSLIERAKSKQGREDDDFRPWQVRELASKRITAMFGESEPLFQTYIPAGRAFFTTYGKAIALFESGSLDPVTSNFGKMVEWIFNENYYVPDRNKNALRLFDEIQYRILKGRLHSKRDTLSFETEDGRTLSLAHLSSGTQEALPLLRSLRTTLVGGPNRTVFAEEPEVHLFPNAQLEIVKLFCWLANMHRQKSCWVLTTHSPYILTAFNDLIKAGQVAKARPKKTAEIEKIVSRDYWVKEGDFAAFAFDGRDGILKPILDPETALIDGGILDSISATIGAQFEQMLEIQYES